MMRVEEVTSAQTLLIRAKVLRPGKEPDEALFLGVMPPEARHFAVYEDDQIIGAGFVVPVPAPFDPQPKAWMLRGMAVDPDLQGKGAGRLIVERVLEEANREGIEMLWFNARRIAVGFYHRLGFEPIGEEFEIPDIGPHTRMFKRLNRT